MSSIVLGIRSVSNEFQRIKVDNVNFDEKVKLLKEEAVKYTNKGKESIELIYCGLILDDESSLSSCGVKPGVMVHVIEKKPNPEATTKRTLSDAEIQQLVVAFKVVTSSSYRAALQRLSRPEVLENIIAATPGLADDPVAISIIKDPELIVHLSDLETVKRIAELHPCLIEAANQIAAHVHEEASLVNHHHPSTSTGYSYSLDALSDDDDMESPERSNRESQPLTRNSSYNAITAAQLAAAIANATHMNFTSSGAPANSRGNIITSEMFSNAMQQAIASSGSTNTSPPNQNEDETLETIRARLQPQLRQMHEMGLINDSVNIRALQATSGDVQAAIELVFNGVID